MQHLFLATVILSCGAIVAAAPPTKPATTQAETPFDHIVFQIRSIQPLQNGTDVAEQLKLDEKQTEQVAADHQNLLKEIDGINRARKAEAAAAEDASRELARAAFQPASAAQNDRIVALLRKHEPYFRVIAAAMQKYRVQVFAQITPQQRLAWETLTVRIWLDDQGLLAVQLSSEQQKAMQALCEDAGKQLVPLGDDPAEDRVSEVEQKALETCRDKVLTAEQRKQAKW